MERGRHARGGGIHDIIMRRLVPSHHLHRKELRDIKIQTSAAFKEHSLFNRHQDKVLKVEVIQAPVGAEPEETLLILKRGI